MCDAVAFRLITFPIFLVASAHPYDFSNADKPVKLSAALIFFFVLGVIAAPHKASELIEAYGPSALFLMISAGRVNLVLYGLYRKQVCPIM